MDITYIGYSDEIIKIILNNSKIALKKVITSIKKLQDDTLKLLNEKGINCSYVANKQDIYNITEQIKTTYVLIYKFAYIIPKNIIDQFIFFNIHPGDLLTNRGAHPIRWSILNGDRETKLTLYKISGIDEGFVIGEVKINILEEDNYITIDRRMNENLNKLIEKLIYYDSNKPYPLIQEGKYNRKVEEKDYCINLKTDDYFFIKRKINSVIDFGGAVICLDNKKYRVSSVSYQRQEENTIKVETCMNENIILTIENFEWR